MMYRSPVFAPQSGNYREHGLRREVLAQLLLPALRSPGQLPDVQAPAMPRWDPHPGCTLQRGLVGAGPIDRAKTMTEHVEHTLALGRIRVRGNDRGKVEGFTADAGHRTAPQLTQIVDRRAHGSFIELIARHQI